MWSLVDILRALWAASLMSPAFKIVQLTWISIYSCTQNELQRAAQGQSSTNIARVHRARKQSVTLFYSKQQTHVSVAAIQKEPLLQAAARFCR